MGLLLDAFPWLVGFVSSSGKKSEGNQSFEAFLDGDIHFSESGWIL